MALSLHRLGLWQPVLNKNFDIDDIAVMKLKGTAPPAPKNQWYKSKDSYELHHINRIHNGGGVYDLDNLLIVTPRYHKEVLDPKFHHNRK